MHFLRQWSCPGIHPALHVRRLTKPDERSDRELEPGRSGVRQKNKHFVEKSSSAVYNEIAAGNLTLYDQIRQKKGKERCIDPEKKEKYCSLWL